VLIKKSVIVLIALLLSACGYHFRGAFELPVGMKNIFLDGGSAQLQAQFKKAMGLSSIPIAASAEVAGIVIRIFDENSQRRVLSLAATGVANDFELGYRMEYEIVDAKDNVLIERQPLEIKREYYNDQMALIAKESEETIIKNEMYLQAVRTIVNRAKSVIDAKLK
jgi:LPS-assembly lipoprotein